MKKGKDMNHCEEKIKPISTCGKFFSLFMLIGLIVLGAIVFYKFVNFNSLKYQFRISDSLI